ncbi:unnamed protein product, partial [Strongylus vulgaris]
MEKWMEMTKKMQKFGACNFLLSKSSRCVEFFN